MRAEQSVSQGSVIKVLAVYDHPFWREDGLSGEAFASYQFVREAYDNSPPSGEPGVLVSFLPGERCEEAERMSADERRAVVLEGFATFFGDEARNAVDFIEVDWSAEEWTRGAYSATFEVGGLEPFRRRPAPTDRPVPLGLHGHLGCREHAHGGRHPLGAGGGRPSPMTARVGSRHAAEEGRCR